jgi:hypothetical protein
MYQPEGKSTGMAGKVGGSVYLHYKCKAVYPPRTTPINRSRQGKAVASEGEKRFLIPLRLHFLMNTIDN